MQLIPKWAKLDFAFLPIGDNFTMDVADALICADFIQCNQVIGMHYDTFGFIKIDHESAIGAFRSAGKSLLLPPIGSSLDI
jgi:L-ascorbate metabolism protein UlaG (beta-lactamase superfamily)